MPINTTFFDPLPLSAANSQIRQGTNLKSLDGNVVWVRVPPPAPAFAREAREGCHAGAAYDGLRGDSRQPSGGALKLDLDRFRRDFEDLVRETKKDADGFIARAKEAIAAAEPDEHES